MHPKNGYRHWTGFLCRRASKHLYHAWTKALLTEFLGANQTRTTSYHMPNNGAVKQFHRQLKNALMEYLPDCWLDVLCLVLIGIQTSYKDYMVASSAELAYGTAL
ncbi:integrase catalytic domain-containing protein [Nephila pilipes]|uniref:Integrase catalytic domain-containing protein n=1 Tax=Nephila pilipes TaxID=299642 RepID=A0A8X6T6T9_NEPPI|nr:integrase catalytic domain-containing protein [Nephila pilipes]